MTLYQILMLWLDINTLAVCFLAGYQHAGRLLHHEDQAVKSIVWALLLIGYIALSTPIIYLYWIVWHTGICS